MEYQVATTKDISAIRQIASTSWRDAYKDILSEHQIEYMLERMYSETQIETQLENPKYRYILFSENNSLIGFMGYEHDYEPNTTKLHRIYLLPAAKGKGIGKKGIDYLKEQVRKFGNQRIILNVNKINPAKNFYETIGFKVYDQGVFDIGGGYVMDDFLMELSLSHETF